MSQRDQPTFYRILVEGHINRSEAGPAYDFIMENVLGLLEN